FDCLHKRLRPSLGKPLEELISALHNGGAVVMYQFATLFTAVCTSLIVSPPPGAPNPGSNEVGASDPASWIESSYPSLFELYRHLHAHPELSFHEIRTAARIAAELRDAGLDVTEEVGKTGVVGMLRNGDGPTIMVRTDLDALPVSEATGLPYASEAT